MVRSLLVSSVLALGFGCGGGSSDYRLPVDSPLKPFEPPTEAELVAASEEEDWDIDFDDIDGEESADDGAEDEGGDAAETPEAGTPDAVPASTKAAGEAGKTDAAKKAGAPKKTGR